MSCRRVTERSKQTVRLCLGLSLLLLDKGGSLGGELGQIHDQCPDERPSLTFRWELHNH